MAAGALAEGTAEISLPGSRRTGDERDLMLVDPVAAGEAEDDGSVEAPFGSEVEIFDGCGGEPEFGLKQESSAASVLAHGALSIEEQSEAILKGQRLDIRDTALFFESSSHAGELEFIELGERLFDEHMRIRPFSWKVVCGSRCCRERFHGSGAGRARPERLRPRAGRDRS